MQRRPYRRGSKTQALATTRTTRIDDRAATLGAHTHEKAMRALAANDGRLVGAFHVDLGIRMRV